MKYLSVCSGVEAASQAWEPLGWEPVAFSEIEPFPCAVLASRFPNVPNLGDMSKIHYDRETKELTNGTTRLLCPTGIDLLVGGTPCQSFSVAGKRAGLEGASGLAYHYARLLGEIQPRWFVWENVPGALSSVTYGDQRDFNFLLHQFAIGGDASLGCRWNLCWRVLDTQYVRVERFPRAIPQRRRRVFVVGHLAADCRGGCEVLLEPEGVRGNPPPRRVKGQGFTRDFAESIGGADGEKRVTYPINSMIIGEDAKEGDRQTTGIGDDGDPLPTLQSAHHHAVAYCINPQNGSLMTPCTKEVGQTNAVGHENGVAISFIPGNSAKTRSIGASTEANITLASMNGESGNKPSVAIAYDGYNQTAHDECTFPLRTANGSEGDDRTIKVAVAFNAFQGTHDAVVAKDVAIPNVAHDQTAVAIRTANTHVNSCGVAVEASHTMDGANGQAVAIGLDPYNACATGGVSKTINSAAATDKDHIGAVAIGIGRDAFNSGANAQMAQSISTEVQPPITAKGPGGGYASMADHERGGCDADT